jgi:ribokinase
MAPIVVLGSLNVDFVAPVPVLPGPGETVLGGDLGTFAGGKGANQAVAAARLGGRVAMVGRVGADAHGELLVRRLEQDGVDAGGVLRDPEAPTGAALIMVAAGGENVIAVAPGANARVDAADVRRAMETVDEGGLLLLQLEIPLPAVGQAALEAGRAGRRVLLNAAPAARLDLALLENVEAVVANEVEAAALLGRGVGSPAGALEAAAALAAAGPRLAVVTLGAAGAAVHTAGRSWRAQPFPVEAVDTTAAGDAFAGALAAGLAAGVGDEAAVRLASAAGAATATRAGAQDSLPRPADLRRLFGLDWPGV